MINLRRQIVLNQPHSVTVSGSLVHFETDFPGLMQITGSGNIWATGKNLIDDSKRYSAGIGYSLYIGATGTGYDIYLKAGTYRFSAQFLNGARYDLFYRRSDGNATNIWRADTGVSEATFTLSQGGWYRFNMTGVTPANVGNCMLSVANDTGYESYNGVTGSAGQVRQLTGVNNVWSDSGDVSVTYWTH